MSEKSPKSIAEQHERTHAQVVRIAEQIGSKALDLKEKFGDASQSLSDVGDLELDAVRFDQVPESSQLYNESQLANLEMAAHRPDGTKIKYAHGGEDAITFLNAEYAGINVSHFEDSKGDPITSLSIGKHSAGSVDEFNQIPSDEAIKLARSADARMLWRMHKAQQRDAKKITDKHARIVSERREAQQADISRRLDAI